MSSVNEILRDRGISHAVYLERYKSSVVRKIMELLNQADTDIAERLASVDEDSFTKRRLESLLKEVRGINEEAMSEFQKKAQLEFTEFAGYESGFQAKTIENAIPIKWNMTQPSSDQIYAAAAAKPFENRLISDHMNNVSQRRIELVDGAIRQGWIQGETIQQVSRRIRGSRKLKYRDGILEKSRSEISSLVRTATNHFSNESRNALYAANDDLIKGIQVVATLDSHTTLICMNLDGKVFDIDKAPQFPQHWGCRTTTIPVLKSWRELGINMDEAPPGTRASMNGQIPSTLKYEDWLKQQSEADQIEALGRKRWELWKNGVPISKFVSNGQILNLRELAEKEGIAIPEDKKTPVQKNVPNFKKHIDASNWTVKNKIAMYSNFTGVHPEIARDWIKGAIATQARVPGLKMDFLGTAQERNRMMKDLLRPEAEQWVSAYYEPGTKRFESAVQTYLNRRAPRMGQTTVAVSFWGPPIRGVGINSKYGKTPEDFNSMVKRNVESGWWAKTDNMNVSYIIAHEMGHEIDRMYLIGKDPRILNIFRSEDIKNGLSTYGSQSRTEMVAEAWAEYTTSKNPRPISKRIGEIIEEVVRDTRTGSKEDFA